MSDGKPSSKWEAKQRAAKAAEAKFEENQARAKKHAAKRAKKHGSGQASGSKQELDDVGSALGDVEVVSKTGVLGWIVGHKAVLGILVALAAGGVIFGMCKCINYRLKTIPGWPRSELFIAGNPGTLILIEHVEVGGKDSKGNTQAASGKGERLTAVDAATGSQLAVEVTEYKECWVGGSRVVCVNIYDQVEILDPRTLAVAGAANDLIAAAKLAKPTRRYEKNFDGVTVVLEDGRGAQIDPSSLKVTVLDTVNPSSSFPPSSERSCSTDSRLMVGATTLIFEGGTRNKLTSEPPPPAESATPSGPPLSYLDGGFLRGIGLPIVLSKQTMDKPEQIVSRVEGISKETWAVALQGSCRQTWVDGPHLVVATSNPAVRAIAIELASGRIAWTFGR